MKLIILSFISGVLFASFLFVFLNQVSSGYPVTPKGIDDRLTRMDVEYQFIVTDTTMTVYDNSRVVGSVPIEGHLNNLINADNL